MKIIRAIQKLFFWVYLLSSVCAFGFIDIEYLELFHPPEGLTPGDVRYINKIGYDSKVFASEVVNMAVHGFLKIKHEPGFWSEKYTLIKNQESQAEAAKYKHGYLLTMLFPRNTHIIELVKSSRQIIQNTTKKLAQNVKNKFKKKYFLNQSFYYMIGIPFIVITFILSIAVFNHPFFFIVMFMFFVLFLYFLKGYNKAGLKVKNQIEGFKLFLATTEEDRLKVIGTPPTRTPELYEKYLPYAIALGVEKQWTQKFAPVFARLEKEGNPYVPIWYMGTGRFDRFDTESFSSFTTDLTRSVDSSSGSSGSGRSGGGGGGGGGGSW